MQNIDFEDEFWSNVDVQGPDECWPWRAGMNNTGYGCYSWEENPNGYAHVYAFEDAHRELEENEEIRHKCDNPICCNPFHLTCGTRQDNMRDKCRRGRHNSVGVPLFKEEQVWRMRQLYWEEGVSQNVLAEAFGISQAGVSQIVRGKRYPNLPMPENNDRATEITVNDDRAEEIKSIAKKIEKKKEEHNSSNLTPSDVRYIRTQFWTAYDSNGKTQREVAEDIADEYKMSVSHIKQVATGKKWPYIGGPTDPEELSQQS